MAGDVISLKDAAVELDVHEKSIHRIVKRLDTEGKKRRDRSRANQLVTYISQAEFALVAREVARGKTRIPSGQSDADGNEDFISSEQGVFYLVQLEPEHDPNRFKVGFAGNMPERLRALCCSAPFVKVVKTWPCKRRWEKTAIDFVTWDCNQLHTEVFRHDLLDDVIAKCEEFFRISPPVDARDQT
ncbi:MAG: hypothetical protein O7D91_20095 [Planctomycetota bacterium]|nr:hypothetical protein [Planctomycetota bacterium]